MKKTWSQKLFGLRDAAIFAGIFLLLLIGIFTLTLAKTFSAKDQEMGITFSWKYARDLGLDPREVFSALVNDLEVSRVRIPVYWNDVQPTQEEWNFTELDALLAIAEVKHVQVTLAIGLKVPRWPECFAPDFIETNSASFDGDLLRYLYYLVSRYRDHVSVVRWQIENEPLFFYGLCPEPSLELLQKEVALVRALDPVRPIMLTVSGEQESWLDVASLADSIGVSMYRFAFHATLGTVAFPHRPFYYRVHAMIAQLFVHNVLVSELQMEPWFRGSPQDPSAIVVPFTVQDFWRHMTFVRQTGMREVLLWGGEWWYYRKLHGDSSLWDAAKEVFHNP